MTLRKRTFVLMIAMAGVAFVILYGVSRVILLDSFVRLETQNTRENLQRIVNTLSDELNALEGSSGNWANWDETYFFLRDGSSDYVTVNMIDDTFYNLNLNLIAFANLSGEIVYERAFDLANGTDLPIPGDITRHLALGSLLTSMENEDRAITGILLLDGTPALVVARPVLTSASEGTSPGTLFFARYLDTAKVAQLSDSVRLSVTLSNYDSSDLAPDFQAAKAAFGGEVTEIIRPRDDTTVSAYALLRDVYGDPAVILRAEMPRVIYEQGWNTITYFVVALVIVGVVFGLSNLGLLERFVLSRVAELNTGVSNIRSSGDPTARVSVSGSDELAELANAINGMIESLAESQKRVWASERQLQTVVNNVPVTLWALDKQGEIILLRGKGLQALGFQRVSASAQLDSGVFRNVRPMIEHSRNALLKGEESGVILTTGNRVFDTRYSPLRDEKDGIIGVIGIATDITEQKQAADALEFALARVEKQNREIERVHEFYRASLEHVISTVKLGATRGELLDYLHQVQSEFDRLQNTHPKQPNI